MLSPPLVGARHVVPSSQRTSVNSAPLRYLSPLRIFFFLQTSQLSTFQSPNFQPATFQPSTLFLPASHSPPTQPTDKHELSHPQPPQHISPVPKTASRLRPPEPASPNET